MELYGFTVHWFLLLAEEHSTSSNMVRKNKSGAAGGHNLKTFDWSAQKLKAFDLASWLLDLKLTKLWTLPPDRLTFVTLFTKPAYQLLENPAHAKSNPIKERIFRVISLCVKQYDHLPGKLRAPQASECEILTTLFQLHKRPSCKTFNIGSTLLNPWPNC